ncbi:MAG TPA: hypothetical protein VIF60_03160 [Burkholderiaceae bacterium]
MLFLSLAGLLTTLALFVDQSREKDKLKQESSLLSAMLKQSPQGADQQKALRGELPEFDNTSLVKVLNHLAGETKLTLDEVSFALDDNANQPFLRYRATLTVSSGYPTIRRFLDQVHAELPQASLDSIVCTRDDITTLEPTCDLIFSAFYRKPSGG